jgi:high-affinity iron transporter
MMLIAERRLPVAFWRHVRRAAPWVAGGAALAALLWVVATAGGVPDPTARHLSKGAVMVDSGLLVFREGLEAILVLAAVTASMVGRQPYRGPVASGAGLAFGATVLTWFAVVAAIGAVNTPELNIQAATGLLAVVVLLVIMNWFFHKIYWTGWIAHHQRRRRRLTEQGGDQQSRTYTGLVLLGFTAMYREGFEVVLFLQNLRLQAGTATVMAGVAIGLVFTLAVGTLTFIAHHRLPYKKMLVLTGVMLGGVLVVMVGESAQEMQLAGWIPTTVVPLRIPSWLSLWLAIFPSVETLGAQAAAALAVIGSYAVAEYSRVWRPRRRAAQVAAARAGAGRVTRDT